MGGLHRSWVRFRAALPLSDVTVVIDNGRAVATRGTIRPGLLSELTEVARVMNIDSACIRAQATSLGWHLSFVGIPKECQQRFRNVWGAHWR
jgi:hypothetical protein